MVDSSPGVRRLTDVARDLRGIAADAQRDGDRRGYFAALYVHVAERFELELQRGVFQHPELMEQLDVVFFDRYLAALRADHERQPVTAPWKAAFDAASESRYSVLQQLMLGMNAHILFDLGIAVADAIPEDQLPALHQDFLTMNGLLESLLGTVLGDLGTIWPPYRWIQCLLGNVEDQIIMFGMRGARDYAWSLANSLAAATPAEREVLVSGASQISVAAADVTRSPPFPASWLLGLAALTEIRSPARVIQILLDSGEQLLGMAPRDKAPSPAPAPSPTPGAGKKRKIAVLGGGVGAMTAAYHLSDPENPASKDLELTVYQMGFRTGGKGASGRGPYGRIQEHGLHVWSGMYDNAFRVMRGVYAELDRPTGAPLATFDEAFERHDLVVLMEKVGDQFEPWTLRPPFNPEQPGTGGLFLSIWDYLIEAIEAALGLLLGEPKLRRAAESSSSLELSAPAAGVLGRMAGALSSESHGVHLLHAARVAAELLRKDGARAAKPAGLLGAFAGAAEKVEGLAAEHVDELLHAFMHWLWPLVRDVHGVDRELRRLWILFNFGFANAVGIVRDGVWLRGFDCINGQDYASWMAKYAFDDGGLMLRSPMVTGQYDGCFAFPGAALGRASMEAGIGLRVNVRAFFTYKGAVMWKMQASMGDTIFAPLYEVLRKRGVRFEFFHQVTNLVPNADGTLVEKIEVDVQAELTSAQEARGGYEPLTVLGGLPVFPDRPLYEQLVNGAKLAAEGVDFESYDGKHAPASKKVLVRGVDFDDVLCGISLGALPYVAGELIEQTPRLKLAVDHVQTISTQAYQLWMNKTSAELGWSGDGGGAGSRGEPITSCLDYAPVNSVDTWGDMTFLAEREEWPAGFTPKSIAYFCAAVEDTSPLFPTPRGPMQAPATFDQKAADASALPIFRDFLEGAASFFFPRVAGGEKFDWSTLLDPSAKDPPGPERLRSQWIRRNVQPPERYVLSVAGSNQYRFPVHDETSYRNLVWAGDFTECTLNVGCVEAAAISGCLASNALSAYPSLDAIVGLGF